jgi:hypothetical protein
MAPATGIGEHNGFGFQDMTEVEQQEALTAELLKQYNLEKMPQGCNWIYEKRGDSERLVGYGYIARDDNNGRVLMVMDEQGNESWEASLAGSEYIHNLANPSLPSSYYRLR